MSVGICAGARVARAMVRIAACRITTESPVRGSIVDKMTRKLTAWSVGLILALGCAALGDSVKTKDDPANVWKSIRKELQSERGPQYFKESVKDFLIPDIRRRLISMRPQSNPTELTL